VNVVYFYFFEVTDVTGPASHPIVPCSITFMYSKPSPFVGITLLIKPITYKPRCAKLRHYGKMGLGKPKTGSRVSSGSIVSDYGLEDRAIEVRSPAGTKDFSCKPLCPDRL
jgi:hypothetical protein